MVVVSYKPHDIHRSLKTKGYVFELAIVRQLLHAGLWISFP
jgi:hypothetical protein